MRKLIFSFVSILAIVLSLNFISASGCPAGWTQNCNSFNAQPQGCWTGTSYVPYCNGDASYRIYDHYCAVGDVYENRQCCVGYGHGCSGQSPARTCIKTGFLNTDCPAGTACQDIGGWPSASCVASSTSGGGDTGGGPTCTPSVEVFDSLDNDCDGSVDELPWNSTAMAYWTFDTDDGSTSVLAVDVKKNFNGTVSGASRPNGVKEQAYSFDGVNDFINFTTFRNLDVSPLTIAAFVKVNSYSDAGLINQWGNSNGTWNLRLNNSGFSLAIFDGAGDSELSYDTSATNSWICLASVYSEGECYIYVNGVLESSSACGFPYTDLSSPLSLVMGRDSVISGTNYFSGLMDEVVLWNSTLNDSQISDWCGFYNYALTPTLESPLFYSPNSIASNISTTGVNDTVLVSFQGENLYGKKINYSLSKYNAGTWVSIYNGSFEWNSASKISDVVYEDIPLNDLGLSASNILRINSSVYLTNVYNLSGNLTLTATSNSAPIASIVSPNSTFYTFANGSNIRFRQNSSDDDDLLDISWDFGYGSNGSAFFTDYSFGENSSSADVTFNYSTPGFYNVKLTARESLREQSSESNITVQILKAGINVVPVISSPEPGATYLQRTVLFNGSRSYVLNCSIAPLVPTGGTDFITNDSVLNCHYIHSPGSYREQNLPGTYRLVFNWSMGEGVYLIKNWSANNYFSDGGIEFLHYYPTGGLLDTRYIKLKITYENL